MAPRGGLRQDRADDLGERPVGQRHVEESRRGDINGPHDGAGEARVRGERPAKCLGDPERRHPAGPGELHREVRREVAVLRIRRPLDLDRRPIDGRDSWQGTGRRRAIPRCLERGPGARAERHERCGSDVPGHASSLG